MGIVKPFSKWNTEKITILKGQKATKVFIPIFLSEKKANDYNKYYNTDVYNKDTIMSFILGNVFDISQTSYYEEFIKEREKAINEVDKNTNILDYEKTKEFIFKNGFDKKDFFEKFDNTISSKGSYNIKDKTITITTKNSHTIIHEFSHFLTIDFIDKHFKEYNYQYGEIIAEILSYFITQKMGVNEYNFLYSKIWSDRIPNKDIKKFEKLINFCDKQLKTLIF